MIVDRKALSDKVCQLKKHGKVVVLASGAFDLIHVGHVRYLQWAAKEGDILVVAVNSDESIHRYKGERPMVPLAERMEIINAIDGVQFVTSFDEPTTHSIVSELLPNVHTKGPEYSAEALPEYEFITGLGIRVAFLHGSKQHSTSALKSAIESQRTRFDQKHLSTVCF